MQDFSVPNPIDRMFTAGGEPTFSLNITIVNDNDFEGFHSFSITISGGLISPGAIPTTTVVISDVEGEQFCSGIIVIIKGNM